MPHQCRWSPQIVQSTQQWSSYSTKTPKRKQRLKGFRPCSATSNPSYVRLGQNRLQPRIVSFGKLLRSSTSSVAVEDQGTWSQVAATPVVLNGRSILVVAGGSRRRYNYGGFIRGGTRGDRASRNDIKRPGTVAPLRVGEISPPRPTSSTRTKRNLRSTVSPNFAPLASPAMRLRRSCRMR